MNRVLRTSRGTVNTAAYASTTKEQILQALGCDEATLLLAIEIAEGRRGKAVVNAARELTAAELEFATPANILLSAESHQRIGNRKRQHSAHTFRVEVERMVETKRGRFIDGPPILLRKDAK